MPLEKVPEGYEEAEDFRWEVHFPTEYLETWPESEFIRLVRRPGEQWGTVHLVLFKEDDPDGTPRQSIALQPSMILDLVKGLSYCLSRIQETCEKEGWTDEQVHAWFNGEIQSEPAT